MASGSTFALNASNLGALDLRKKMGDHNKYRCARPSHYNQHSPGIGLQ